MKTIFWRVLAIWKPLCETSWQGLQNLRQPASRRKGRGSSTVLAIGLRLWSKDRGWTTSCKLVPCTHNSISETRDRSRIYWRRLSAEFSDSWIAIEHFLSRNYRDLEWKPAAGEAPLKNPNSLTGSVLCRGFKKDLLRDTSEEFECKVFENCRIQSTS